MKKNIGIISLVGTINYGAILQALALQVYLEKLGTNAEYFNFKVRQQLKPDRLILSLGFSIVRVFFGYLKRLHKTSLFRSNYLHLTPELHNRAELAKQSDKFDLLMVGSDQVWNPLFLQNSEGAYVLDFNNNLAKVSYASSFGVRKIRRTEEKIFRESLINFKSLSVREEEGVKILRSLGLNSQCCIDPTFLLTKQDWLNYFPTVPLFKGRYVCCYVMNGAEKLNKQIIRMAKKLQHQMGDDVSFYILGEKEYKKIYYGKSLVTTAGPSEFLNILYNAEFVLTSSFHGTCFCLNFQKNFYSILSKSNPFNSRIENLLLQVGLGQQIIYVEDMKSVRPVPIEYESPITLLNDYRNESISYLKRVIV